MEVGQVLVITLASNPTTGCRWEAVELDEPILQQMGEPEFKTRNLLAPKHVLIAERRKSGQLSALSYQPIRSKAES